MKALVTGASSGIGRDIAKELSKRGYDLILVARNVERLEEVKKQIQTKAEIISMDISKEENCEKLFQDYKDIDILVNNAGFGDCGHFEETSLDKDIQMIKTNIIAYHILTKLYLKEMIKNNNGKILNVKYITSLNFRIARQIRNCSNSVLKEIVDFKNQTIYNTLIVAPPGKGKTTVLRDAIRKISNGINEMNFKGKTCGVVDERGEIAAMYKGVPQNDIGMRTDVVENVSKSQGMKMLIRSMAPEVIACDEIGSKEDVEAIKEVLTAGVKGIFTMHGRDMRDIKNNVEINKLVETRQIEKVIFLNDS